MADTPVLLDLSLLAEDQWSPTIATADASLAALDARVLALTEHLAGLDAQVSGAAAAEERYAGSITIVNNELTILEANISTTTTAQSALTVETQAGTVAADEHSGALGRLGSAAGMAGLALVGIGAAAEVTGVKFEAAMSKIEGFAGVSHTQLESMKTDILAISDATGESPAKLAEGLYFVISAGFQGADAMNILRQSTDVAKAALIDTKPVADVVTSALRAYGESASDTSHVLDVLVQTTVEGKMEFADLAGSLGRLLPVASQSGVSLEEVGAAIATMTQKGLSADEAVTSIRGTLLALEAPNKSTREELAALGLTVDQVRESIREKGYLQTLTELYRLTGGNTDAMKELVPNVRALVGVFADMGKSGDDAAGVFERISNAHGAAAHATEVHTATQLSSFERLKAGISVDLVDIADLMHGGDILSAWADFFTNINNEAGRAQMWNNFKAHMTDLLDFTKGILGDMGGFFGSLWDRISGGGSHSTSADSSRVTAAAGQTGPVPGFADGTGFFSGGLALVGERGPELVTLPAGSAVFSHGDSAGLLSAAGMAGVPGFADGTGYPTAKKGDVLNADQLTQGLISAGMAHDLIPTMVAILLQEQGPVGVDNDWHAGGIGQIIPSTWAGLKPSGMTDKAWADLRLSSTPEGIQAMFGAIVRLQASHWYKDDGTEADRSGFGQWDPYIGTFDPATDDPDSTGHRDPSTGEWIIGRGKGNYVHKLPAAQAAFNRAMQAQAAPVTDDTANQPFPTGSGAASSAPASGAATDGAPYAPGGSYGPAAPEPAGIPGLAGGPPLSGGAVAGSGAPAPSPIPLLQMPVDLASSADHNGRVTQPYGPTTVPGEPIVNGVQTHRGIDYGVSAGTAITAAGAGKVIWAGDRGDGLGNSVEIDHGNGVTTVYGHLRKLNVKAGDTVSAGGSVGEAGSTGFSDGPHLHFEVRKNGVQTDPTPYLNGTVQAGATPNDPGTPPPGMDSTGAGVPTDSAAPNAGNPLGGVVGTGSLGDTIPGVPGTSSGAGPTGRPYLPGGATGSDGLGGIIPGTPATAPVRIPNQGDPTGGGPVPAPGTPVGPVAPAPHNPALVSAQIAQALHPSDFQTYDVANTIASMVENGSPADAIIKILALIPADQYAQVISLAQTMITQRGKERSKDVTDLLNALDSASIAGAGLAALNVKPKAEKAGDTTIDDKKIDAIVNPNAPASRVTNLAEQVAHAIESGDLDAATKLLASSNKTDYSSLLSEVRSILKADADRAGTDAKTLQGEQDATTTAATAAAPSAAGRSAPKTPAEEQQARDAQQKKDDANREADLKKAQDSTGIQFTTAGGAGSDSRSVSDSQGQSVALAGEALAAAMEQMSQAAADTWWGTYFAKSAGLITDKLTVVNHVYAVVDGRIVSETVDYHGGRAQEFADRGMPTGGKR